MAMLAEPRRKKRSINLRGKNYWSEDQNKFGKKLMEKMGWTEGKGLGMNENGNVDHLKVRFKDDNGGVGFKDLNNQWTEHETNFESLLKNLHGGKVDTKKLHSECSLEEKSKNLQSRLHYKKFTRGKDVTKYSHKDLANIFGKKSLNPVVVDTKDEDVVEVQEELVVSSLKLVEGGCMKEYFKVKMSAVKNYSVEEEKSSAIYEDEESVVAFRGFSFSEDKEPSDKVGSSAEINFCKSSDENVAVIKKSKKNKKSSVEDVKSNASENGLINFCKSSDDAVDESKKNKKKRTFEECEADVVEVTDENPKKKKSKKLMFDGAANDVVEVVENKKSNKKKEKRVTEIQGDEELAVAVSNDHSTTEECVKEKKKNSKKTTVINEEVEDIDDRRSKKDKKKKNKHKNDTINDDGRRLRSSSYSQVVQQCLPETDGSVVDSIASARKLVKRPVDLTNVADIQAKCKSIKEQLKNTVKNLDDVEMEDVSARNVANIISVPSTSRETIPSISSFPTILSSQTASNSWELLSLKRMLDDPFVSATRKQYLNQRILELNDSIIKELLLSTQRTSKSEEILLLENLCSMFDSQNLSVEQKQQLECVLSALRGKVINEIMKDVGSVTNTYEKTIADLQSLLNLKCLSNVEREDIMSKVIDLREKVAKGLLKQTHAPMDDSLHLLDKVKSIMNDPFLPEVCKDKLLHKVRYFKNKTINKLTHQELTDAETDASLTTKLSSLLQDPNLSFTKRLQIIEKIKKLESSANDILRSYRNELKTKMTDAMSEVLRFVGTNLDTISGYGVNIETERYIEIVKPDTS